MATEAQRLIGISLAKIAQSRCGRGGVSLHKNLLVATVLQKARFIFMEEAYHMVHGHYLQANKFLEPDIDIRDDPNDVVPSSDNIDECELDDIFDAPASSIGKDEEASEDFSEELCDKENSPPETANSVNNNSGLVYLDLDKHIQKASSQVTSSDNNNTAGNNNKRRREISEWETEEAVLSILPKKIKSEVSPSLDSSSDSDSDSIYSPDDDIFLSDRIRSTNDDDNNAAINLSVNVSRELELDELNNNINNNNNLLVSNNNNNNTSSSNNDTSNNNVSSNTNSTNLENGPSMEGIDRITSLVSIFSFGNLTRSVSTPDLCSAQATKDSCSSESSISQRTYLAMTV